MSPFLSYNAILTIVIVELVFAFSVGLVCCIFSYNLFRAIQQPHSNVLIPRNSRFMPEDTLDRGEEDRASARSPSANADEEDAFDREEEESEMDYEYIPPNYHQNRTLFQRWWGFLRLW